MKFLLTALLLTSTAAARTSVETLPLNFEPNRGQADAGAQFLARGAGYYLTLNAQGAHVVLRKGKRKSTIDTMLVAANRGTRLIAADPLPGRAAWFRGSDPAKWVTDLPTFARVRATAVYPGIDLVYYGSQSRLEYDFVVAPGANPARIRMAMRGASGLRLDAEGDLIVETPAGELRQQKPVAYQELSGRRQPVPASFVVTGRTISFQLGAYDHAQALTIDPVLVYSSFLGGSDMDEAHAVAADAARNMYLAGVTYSTVNGDGDVLLRKISADGTSFLYIADLGGSDEDVANGIAVDVNGYVYLGGRTFSTDFPTAGANVFQKQNFDKLNAAFVLRLNPDAKSLVYSTYVGGSYDDEGYALAIDLQGNAYLTGTTGSTDYPVSSGAFQPKLRGDFDCFVFKIDNQGNAIYSTYIGGGSDDDAFSIAVDNDGDAYITGQTNSDSYPQANAPFQHSRHGGYDAFVTELNASGSALVFSTFAGGAEDDFGNAIALDSNGNIYVAGNTSSDDFPGTGQGYQSDFQGGFSDGFVLKYLANGSNIGWATFLGTHGTDELFGIAVDANGNIYVAGDTNSDQFPVTADAVQGGRNRGFDGTLSVLDTTGSKLAYSTFFGGQGDDSFFAVAVDTAFNVYLAGSTSSGDLTVAPNNAVQILPGGGDSDALMVKVDLSNSGVPGSAVVTGMPTAVEPTPQSAVASVFGRGMRAPEGTGRFRSRTAGKPGASLQSADETEATGRTTMHPRR